MESSFLGALNRMYVAIDWGAVHRRVAMGAPEMAIEEMPWELFRSGFENAYMTVFDDTALEGAGVGVLQLSQLLFGKVRQTWTRVSPGLYETDIDGSVY